MDQHGVGAGVTGALEELDAGGDARRDLADRAAPLDLKAVGTEVLARGGVQQPVEVIGQFGDRKLSVCHRGLGFLGRSGASGRHYSDRWKKGRIVADPAQF